MKVGDYVRTKDGSIDKIKGIEEEYHIRGNDEEDKLYLIYQLKKDYYDDEYDEISDWVFEDFIIKSSPNIINLIEVGDYVNGSYIYDIVEENKKTGQPRVLFAEENGVLGNGDIKSIVTKEAFSNAEYRVETD